MCAADCLDGGNNKKAVQEADRLLKKQKDFPCAKASHGRYWSTVTKGHSDKKFRVRFGLSLVFHCDAHTHTYADVLADGY